MVKLVMRRGNTVWSDGLTSDDALDEIEWQSANHVLRSIRRRVFEDCQHKFDNSEEAFKCRKLEKCINNPVVWQFWWEVIGGN